MNSPDGHIEQTFAASLTREARIEYALLRLLALETRSRQAINDHSIDAPLSWEWNEAWDEAYEAQRG